MLKKGTITELSPDDKARMAFIKAWTAAHGPVAALAERHSEAEIAARNVNFHFSKTEERLWPTESCG